LGTAFLIKGHGGVGKSGEPGRLGIPMPFDPPNYKTRWVWCSKAGTPGKGSFGPLGHLQKCKLESDYSLLDGVELLLVVADDFFESFM
jgi:hypothetical protein